MCALALEPSPSLRRRKLFVTADPDADADEALLARIAAGDREAFAALFRAYAGRIKAYLIRLGAPGAVAEDLAQDAMVAVWRRAASFDASRAKASTWLFVIARNCWIDRLRRERVELAYKSGLDEPVEYEDAPDEAVVKLQSRARIGAALSTLPPEQQEVVRLSFFEDQAHAQIAATLSLPLGTVKSRLRLALMKLRAQWEQEQ